MRPQVAGRPLAAAVPQMPAVEGKRGLAKDRHSLERIQQVVIVAVRAAEVLSRQLEPQIASKFASAVAEPTWIGWVA